MILTVVSCTGEFEHPYFANADDAEYADEEYAEEAPPSAER